MPYKDKGQEKKYKKKWNREYYKKNKKKEKERIKKRRSMLKRWLIKYKKGLNCSNCGEEHTACIEFHHKDASKKEFSLSEAVSHGCSKNRMIKESQKCIVLCANCHRKHHYVKKKHKLRQSIPFISKKY